MCGFENALAICLRAMPESERDETRKALNAITGKGKGDAQALLRLYETYWKQSESQSQSQSDGSQSKRKRNTVTSGDV